MCLGIPGQIVALSDADPLMAVADISGVRRMVSVACVAGPTPADLIGQWVLVHVGFAMAIIDAEEAARTLEALRDLGEAQEALDQMAAADQALAS